MARKIPLGILISGNGSNFQAIIDAIEKKQLDAEVRVVISNREEAYGLVRAQQHGVPTEIVDHGKFPSREAFDQHLIERFKDRQVELVVLAGFMRLLSADFVHAYSNRIMNIHPALLPAFPGLHVQRKAVEAGVRFSGCTVHFVNEECDQGPIIIQAVVPVFPDDSEESLSARILKEEHRIYPKAIQLYSEGRLHVAGQRVLVDGLEKEEQVMVHPPLKG
ncbi:MAG: phosphoribosylglycinamide formyltransferase [Deltaproteobacteria bacterium]|nr:phosphoribosylglycinamide formyltransferase [Deltaproteobacteria bacterium]